MTFPEFASPDYAPTRLDASPSYWDPQTECTVVYAKPSVERELWKDFVRGACHSYQQHGVAAAIDTDALRRGDDTGLFAACVDHAGNVVAGIRAQVPTGPRTNATRSWSGTASPARTRSARWSPTDCRSAWPR